MNATTTSLADLATTRPAASRIFHRHGLDFCCGGKRRLDEACAELSIDPITVLHEIEAEETGTEDVEWGTRPLGELIEHIVDHYHRRLREEIPELITLARKVENVHASRADAPVGLAAHLTMIHEAVLDHLEKEEQLLFPMILAGAGGQAAAPVRAMEHEHDDHGANLRIIRSLTNQLSAPDDACETWRALYLRLAQLELELMEHIHLENNVLFPRALRG